MFDFIKKIFGKPTKKAVKKKTCDNCSVKKQSASQNKCSIKSEKKAVDSVSFSDVKPTVSEVSDTPIEAKKCTEAEKQDVTLCEALAVTPTVQNESKEEDTASLAKYIIKITGKDTYRFSLVSPDGKAIIKSDDYTLKRSCVSGIQSVRKNGATENIEDRTVEPVTKVANPKYEITVDENSKYRYTLKAPNGYVILRSSSYSSKKGCMKSIDALRIHSQTELVDDMTK